MKFIPQKAFAFDPIRTSVFGGLSQGYKALAGLLNFVEFARVLFIRNTVAKERCIPKKIIIKMHVFYSQVIPVLLNKELI